MSHNYKFDFDILAKDFSVSTMDEESKMRFLELRKNCNWSWSKFAAAVEAAGPNQAVS